MSSSQPQRIFFEVEDNPPMSYYGDKELSNNQRPSLHKRIDPDVWLNAPDFVPKSRQQPPPPIMDTSLSSPFDYFNGFANSDDQSTTDPYMTSFVPFPPNCAPSLPSLLQTSTTPSDHHHLLLPPFAPFHNNNLLFHRDNLIQHQPLFWDWNSMSAAIPNHFLPPPQHPFPPFLLKRSRRRKRGSKRQIKPHTDINNKIPSIHNDRMQSDKEDRNTAKSLSYSSAPDLTALICTNTVNESMIDGDVANRRYGISRSLSCPDLIDLYNNNNYHDIDQRQSITDKCRSNSSNTILMVAKKKTSSESRPLANRKSNPETHNMMVWQLGGDNSTTKSTLLHELFTENGLFSSSYLDDTTSNGGMTITVNSFENHEDIADALGQCDDGLIDDGGRHWYSSSTYAELRNSIGGGGQFDFGINNNNRNKCCTIM